MDLLVLGYLEDGLALFFFEANGLALFIIYILILILLYGKHL